MFNKQFWNFFWCYLCHWNLVLWQRTSIIFIVAVAIGNYHSCYFIDVYSWMHLLWWCGHLRNSEWGHCYYYHHATDSLNVQPPRGESRAMVGFMIPAANGTLPSLRRWFMRWNGITHLAYKKPPTGASYTGTPARWWSMECMVLWCWDNIWERWYAGYLSRAE